MKGCLRLTLVVVLALGSVAAPAVGGQIPSRAAEGGETGVSREADLATVETFLAREEVAEALASCGLSESEVEQRVARLSAEDLSTLAANVDQIQAAGQVPNYIWILLAILLGVMILATIF